MGMLRKNPKLVEIESSDYSEVVILDEPGSKNACHEYLIRYSGDVNPDGMNFNESRISFQNGPIQYSGVNGCHEEDLIAIVIHRLQALQTGDFKCQENALALTNLEEAIYWILAERKLKFFPKIA